MRLEVLLAKTVEEKEEYYRIIRQVYCEEYNYMNVPYDLFDSIATHFIAVKENTLEAVAAMRVIEPNSVFNNQEGFFFGFPIEEEFDLSPLAKRAKENNEKYVQVSKSAVPKDYQKTFALVTLWRGVYQYIKYMRGYTHWLNSANPETNNPDKISSIFELVKKRNLFHPEILISPKNKYRFNHNPSVSSDDEVPEILKMYERMNHLYIGEPAVYEKASAYALPMILDVNNIGNPKMFDKKVMYRF